MVHPEGVAVQEVLSWLDAEQAVRLVEQLMAIPGKSGEEAAVAHFVRQRLLAAGMPERSVVHDRAHRYSRIDGQCGNLICYLPGRRHAARRLLTAHLDTVPICDGSQPRRVGRYFRSGRADRGLGADDRAGTAVLLNTALTLLRVGWRGPPLTFCWFVQEEIGLEGSRHVECGRLKGPSVAFNWDGGPPDRVTVGATGGYRMKICITGRASHAGVAPQEGVSAIAIAALAIADLHQRGWHGKVVTPDGQGTTNVGVVHGGQATNIVADYVELDAEARSHDPAFRRRLVREIESAFRRAADTVRSAHGKRGHVSVQGRLDYESFLLPENHPSVQTAVAAVRAVGLEPTLAVSQGGLDANWLTHHGIGTVTLGCGQIDPHTTSERLDIKQYLDACRVALLLAAGVG